MHALISLPGQLPRLARGPFVSATLLGLMVLLPSDLLYGQVDAAEPPPGDQADNDARLRTMHVRIVDEQNKPLEGASLHLGIWYVAGYDGPKVKRDYTTDADGFARITIPRQLEILRMWSDKSGYVPRFVNFARGTHEEGKRIPSSFEFRMQPGTEIGGIVVDEAGQPIAGVEVSVSVDVDGPTWTANPESIVSTWLTDDDFGRKAAITGNDGRWRIDNAPAAASPDDFEFRLRFLHDDYVGDSNWGELQSKQGLTTAMLRKRSAKLVMMRGVVVRGAVVDAGQKPVTHGLVIWHDNPYYGPGVYEAPIDGQGRFETLPLAPGEHPFTIVAPGHQPQRKMVDVTKDMDDLDFELEPGKRLAIRFVDSAGHPVPEVYVMLQKWRGTGALYNRKHPNVPESGIPRHADEDGRYLWDWAPADAVTYQFGREGYVTSTATLAATATEHVITLASELVAAGRVTDAVTGEPIAEFEAIPVKQFRPDFMTTLFRSARPGEDGVYELPLADGPAMRERYRVRIEADGYRSVVSESSYGTDAGRVTADFALQRAPAREGVVMDADGNPIVGATVIMTSPSTLPAFRNGRLDRNGRETMSLTDGSFRLRATSEPVRIRILHETGFAEVQREPDEEIGPITLEPWARLSGQLSQQGQPVAGERVLFFPVLRLPLGEPRFQDSYAAETDREGRFTFDRLPPIAGSVRAYLGPWQDSQLTSSQSVPVDLAPGEERTVSLGGVGATITGQVLATGRDEVPLDRNWSLNYLIRRDGGVPLPEGFPELSFNPQEPVKASWFRDPNCQGWLQSRSNYFVKLSPEGQLQINGVPAGTYDLVLQLFEQPAGCLVESVGEKVVPIEVTEADITSGSKDLGAIEVACRTGPRPGQNMQSYRFVDASGREQLILDLEGRFVLVHVWAHWCAPCIASMPSIQAAAANWSDASITVVGLNVDRDRDAARLRTRESGWTWSQTYLGDDSDMARQLAFSTVPTYYLIGPDGRLVTSTNEWEPMRQQVEQRLGE